MFAWINDLKTLIPIYTVFFLTFAYLYQYLYYDKFGIQASRFFALDDYIRAAIDKLYVLGTAFIGVFVNYSLVQMPDLEGQDYRQSHG